MKFVILLMLSVFTSSQILKDNFFVNILSSNNSTRELLGLNLKGRNGFGVIAISSKNNTFEDALVFIFYIKNSNFVINRYIGSNTSFPITNNLWVQKDGLYLHHRDINDYPIGYLVDSISYLIFLNRTLFDQKFG